MSIKFEKNDMKMPSAVAAAVAVAYSSGDESAVGDDDIYIP